ASRRRRLRALRPMHERGARSVNGGNSRHVLIEHLTLVRKGGFEPPRSCERQPLKLVRLPVPPLPQVGALPEPLELLILSCRLRPAPPRYVADSLRAPSARPLWIASR